MANATEAQVGGAVNEQLVCCNRCLGKGIWVGHKSSGTCFACRGSGLLAKDRAQKYLQNLGAHLVQDPDDQAMILARQAKAKAEALGWQMGDPVQLPDRVELLGRNPKRPGKTVHLTWVYETRTRYSEWLEGSPSKHRDLLQP